MAAVNSSVHCKILTNEGGTHVRSCMYSWLLTSSLLLLSTMTHRYLYVSNLVLFDQCLHQAVHYGTNHIYQIINEHPLYTNSTP